MMDRIEKKALHTPTFASSSVSTAVESTITLAGQESSSIPVLPTVHPDSAKSRILLVHADAEMREYVRGLLSQQYTVHEAMDGEAALESALSDPPDLILVDVMMPRIDGFALLRQLRTDKRTANLPVIIIAVPEGEDDSVERVGAGAEDYLTKPFTDKELLARVSAQLQMARVRREAAEAMRVSEIRYRRLFEAAHDGILLVGVNDRKISDVNPFLLKLLNYPREHFIGKELWEIGVFKDKDASESAMQTLDETGTVRYENLPLQDHDGRLWPVEVVANIYQEDHHPVIQCNIREITERVRLEVERAGHLLNEESLRADAEAANRGKDIFLATLSHELRTPLNAIIGWTAILREDNCEKGDLIEGLDVIERSANVQVQLIEDMLDVSRIVSGKLRLETQPCELAEVIKAALEIVGPAAKAKDIRLVSELDAAASHGLYDDARMQQVVWNLLANAIKFTPNQGAVTVRLTREETAVKIRVSDTGTGMDPDSLPYVFDRFRQEDSGTRRRFGGLGLGLSIVKHIVEMHGGTVKASSAGSGHGSTFTVTLPVRAIQGTGEDESGWVDDNAGAKENLKIPTIRLDGLRVLVVDDEADARRMLAKVLDAAGANVTVAGSAAEAMTLLHKVKPNMLVSDIGMPGEDGYDLMRQVRSEGYTPKDLPAIALSAFVSKDYEINALLAGFQVHVSKPVEPQNLIRLIASLAGLAGA